MQIATVSSLQEAPHFFRFYLNMPDICLASEISKTHVRPDLSRKTIAGTSFWRPKFPAKIIENLEKNNGGTSFHVAVTSAWSAFCKVASLCYSEALGETYFKAQVELHGCMVSSDSQKKTAWQWHLSDLNPIMFWFNTTWILFITLIFNANLQLAASSSHTVVICRNAVHKRHKQNIMSYTCGRVFPGFTLVRIQGSKSSHTLWGRRHGKIGQNMPIPVVFRKRRWKMHPNEMTRKWKLLCLSMSNNRNTICWPSLGDISCPKLNDYGVSQNIHLLILAISTSQEPMHVKHNLALCKSCHEVGRMQGLCTCGKAYFANWTIVGTLEKCLQNQDIYL